VLDLKQSENPEWYNNVDDPPLLNPDLDMRGDYRHHITYKVDHHDDDRTTFKDINPTGKVLDHEHHAFFDSSEELLPEFDIEITTDCCIYELTCIVMFTMLTMTLTIPWLHDRSITGPNKSRMTYETTRLFILILHGSTVTLFRKRSRSRPSLPGCL
jgi:hypothetical protein